MGFGIYILFTIDGFSCVVRGQSEFDEAIKNACNNLDIPVSFALYSGQQGFRRLSLAIGKPYYTYSAFIGLSEIKTNRRGSFLAVGIMVPCDFTCHSIELGGYLSDMLNKLVKHVSNGRSFTSKPNQSDLSELYSGYSEKLRNCFSRRADQQNQQKSKGGGRLFLSTSQGKPLSFVYGEICLNHRITEDFYLFDYADKTELRGANLGFTVSPWPADVFQKSNMDNMPILLEEKREGQKSSVRSIELKEPAVDLRATLIKIEDIERKIIAIESEASQNYVFLHEAQARLKFLLWLTNAFCFFLCVLLVFLFYSPRNHTHPESQKQPIKVPLVTSPLSPNLGGSNNESVRDNADKPDASSVSQVASLQSEANTQDEVHLTLTSEMSLESFRKKHCKEYIGSDFKNDFYSLNPSLSKNKIKKDERIALPKGCSK